MEEIKKENEMKNNESNLTELVKEMKKNERIFQKRVLNEISKVFLNLNMSYLLSFKWQKCLTIDTFIIL